jgi:hypothetical protein
VAKDILKLHSHVYHYNTSIKAAVLHSGILLGPVSLHSDVYERGHDDEEDYASRDNPKDDPERLARHASSVSVSSVVCGPAGCGGSWNRPVQSVNQGQCGASVELREAALWRGLRTGRRLCEAYAIVLVIESDAVVLHEGGAQHERVCAAITHHAWR